MPFVKTGGIDLYYELHGEGPPVVFAHPGGGSHLSWWQQIPVFRDQFTCISFDHRGFGQSTDLPDDPGAAAYAGDLAGLLDHLGLERVAIVGQSMGGWTACGFAVAHPERVRALVLANSTGGIRDPEIDAGFARLFSLGPKLLRNGGYAAGFALREPARCFLYHQIVALNLRRPANPRAQFELVHEPKTIVDHQIPVLLITGEEDAIVPPRLVERVAERLPHSRLENVAGAGHSVYFERPEVWNRLVAEFLAAVHAERAA